MRSRAGEKKARELNLRASEALSAAPMESSAGLHQLQMTERSETPGEDAGRPGFCGEGPLVGSRVRSFVSAAVLGVQGPCAAATGRGLQRCVPGDSLPRGGAALAVPEGVHRGMRRHALASALAQRVRMAERA